MSKPITQKRLVGAVVPVGALRSKNSAGVGEFADLPKFAQLCRKMRVRLIQILPVNDTGFDSSPYFSLTAFALHPLYLRIEDLEEFKSAGASVKKRLKEAKEKFEKLERYSHFNVLKEKLLICREIYSANKDDIEKSADNGKLAEWIKNNSWVINYSVYRRLKEVNELKSWKDWTEYKNVTQNDIYALWNDKKLKQEHLFWTWLQQNLDAQFLSASKAVEDAGIVLMGDIPILMNEDSCDVWSRPDIFIQELSAGAPPDMYSPEGQRWGFPIFNWEAQEKDDFAWWKLRLKTAEKYYNAYRIDHVLGFFRIWASSRKDYSSILGRYAPYIPVRSGDFRKLGFDKDRVRWLSRPHIRTGEIWDALKNNWGGSFAEKELNEAAENVFTKALERVGDEELWLFKKKIKGEMDIDALNLHPAARGILINKWHDRTFLQYEKGRYFPVWYYRESTGYKSLSIEEKNKLEGFLEKIKTRSEKIWSRQGKKLLTVLAESSSMLPCAEDLGAVPACVPKVLSRLKILGLRVVRWHRDWSADGQPYVPFEDYPALSVCTLAVHDSSTAREWWEREADQKHFAGFIGVPSLPKIYNPGTAKTILTKTAQARSRFRVFQIQDLLHLSSKWYAKDPAQERINVPGTNNDFNWTYRLPACIEEIAKDKELIAAAAELSRVKPAKKR